MLSSHSETICLTDWKILPMSTQFDILFLIINPHLKVLLLFPELKISINLTIKTNPDSTDNDTRLIISLPD